MNERKEISSADRVKVADNHHAYVGIATGIEVGGHQFVILGKDTNALAFIFAKLKGELDTSICQESAVVKRATLDLIPPPTPETSPARAEKCFADCGDSCQCERYPPAYCKTCNHTTDQCVCPTANRGSAQ